MNSIKLQDLEIKEGYLVKDGVRLTDELIHDFEALDGAGVVSMGWKIGNCFKDCKVKSATIWTEVEDTGVKPEGETEIQMKWNALFDRAILEAISQDPKAYATDIEL